MQQERVDKNAVLDDLELQKGLKQINPKFGDFVIRVAGEGWGLPLIDQKTKALITIAIDVVNQDHRGPGNPFAAHVNMALQQGATRAEIEELLLFLCPYAGFNKVAACFANLNLIFDHANSTPRIAEMLTMSRKAITADYSDRDQEGKVAFYVLLWKRHGISLELFDNYWKDVHGPVCARLPGQHQYWQFHVAHNQGGFCPEIPGLDYTTDSEDNFDGIAELTFASDADRQKWFTASAILMDDEHNLFRKAIGYNSSPGNSITYIDRIPNGDPNGEVGAIKFHVMVKKANGASTEAFRRYLTETFAPKVSSSDSVLKFRLHLFEEVDNSRPDAAGVGHYEPAEKQYHAAYEIAFANHLEREKFFASSEYSAAIKDAAKYIQQIQPFPERTAYTFVYDGQMTLAGQRSAKVAELITKIGAANQIKNDIVTLMVGGQTNGKGLINNGQTDLKHTPLTTSGLGHLLQGVQHVGVTVDDMNQSLEFYTEILGGKLVAGENELVGDVIQNTLFQQEELDAIAKGIDPKNLTIPHLRSTKEDALDVNFISFGNTAVELIYFREAGKPHASHASVPTIPSHIGNVNAMHISFNVKEGVDLNVFANMLEAECHKRGMTNVVCNRVVHVKSEAERRAVALRYNSFKFWNEPESLAAGEPEIDWSHDPMEGWSLFYCKGPNGEQLEFNQVTRKVKTSFQKGMAEYNQANGTTFTFPEAIVTNNIPINGKLDYQQGSVAGKQETQTIAGITNRRNSMHSKFPGTNTDLVKRLFSRGEAFDSEGFITFFTDTPVYQFGNFDVCLDKESIKKSANAFFSQIDAVYHEIKMIWEEGDAVFVEMDVTYWRKDGSVVSLPCFDIFRVEGDKFSELRIFMDVNPVFNPAISVPQSASVLSISQGKQMIPPGTMKKHFAEHPEAQERIDQGYVPKWSIAGPKWPIASVDKIALCIDMETAGGAFNWDKFQTYFTDDVLFRVGASEEGHGWKVIADYLTWFYSIAEPQLPFDFRGTWDLPGVVIIEMDAKYVRRVDGKPISFPCTDILKFNENNKIYEWRVYPDQSELWMESLKGQTK
jgi:alkylhydroperoxidase/carboxymuconolactone decarboxylase family protein YurZ/catechol 2,3-dioxygenase-like lactoylglutathione lyase family enzyme/ketosteroid isomerase-like protein